MTVTYDSIGNAEDFKDAIFDTNTIDHPFMNIAQKSKATGKLHEWLQDGIQQPVDNAKVEGDDNVAKTYTPDVPRENRVQLMDKGFKISDTLEKIKKHGRKSEIKRQSMKKLRELKHDAEFAMTGKKVQAAVAGDGSNPARMASLYSQVDTDNVINHGAATAFTAANGQDSITAGQLAAYMKGGNPDTLLINPVHASAVSGFATQNGRNREVEEKRLVDCIDIIDSDHGTLSVVKGRFTHVDLILGIDSEYADVAVLQQTELVKLARTGHSQPMMWKTELCGNVTNDGTWFAINITPT